MNTMNIHSISIMYSMNSMNYKTSKTSGLHRILLQTS